VNKLNIFMVNVLRFRDGGDVSSLVDSADAGSGEQGPGCCCGGEGGKKSCCS